MKKLLKLMAMVAVFTAGFGCSWGQGTPPSDTAAPPDTKAPDATTDKSSAPSGTPLMEPASTTTPDNTRYLNKPSLLEPCQGRISVAKHVACDILFIGDSITEMWSRAGKPIWDQAYSPRHAVNFGIGGDKTQNVLWRLDNMEIKQWHPKVAVVMIGTNNTRNTPQEIADGVKAVLDKTQAIFPGVKIILVSITPSKRALQKMNDVNAIIKNFADDKTVFWLDLVPLMTPETVTSPDGKITAQTWKGIGVRDLLHPTAEGYQIWHDAMEPLLQKLLADSSAPASSP